MKQLILLITLLSLTLIALPASAVEHTRLKTSQTTISQGIVQWFDHKNGFGYITPDDNSETVFVHFSNIILDESTELQQGQRVVYKVVELR